MKVGLKLMKVTVSFVLSLNLSQTRDVSVDEQTCRWTLNMLRHTVSEDRILSFIRSSSSILNAAKQFLCIVT